MSIKEIEIENAKDLFNRLEELALSKDIFVFRGHREIDWKIDSTLNRHTKLPMRIFCKDLDEMLCFFVYKMKLLNAVPFQRLERRSLLEFGRHHGVPTPIIDFSWSPYVATYFAFDGVRAQGDNDERKAAIFALNIKELAKGWAVLSGSKTSKELLSRTDEFMEEKDCFFDNGYPSDVLKFIKLPASWNWRMHLQQGCFIYDTLSYEQDGAYTSFECFVEKVDLPLNDTGSAISTMFKFIVPYKLSKDVFKRLELMNVNGATLLGQEGVASDIKNSYYYQRKTGFTWDILIKKY